MKRLLGRIKSVLPTKVESQSPPSSRRDRLAVMLAIMTVVCLGAGFVLSNGQRFLMPGPLASAHGAIENCSACHAKSGSGKLSWVQGLVPSDLHADSKACLTCHKMPDTAFNAHGATTEVLKQSTERLEKIAVVTRSPQSARAQSIAFPTHEMVEGGLACATCHQEHQGVNFNLNKISNEQCRSCHVVKFDSFDGNHPKFENYPFKRRTRIIYDHAGHFGKHYPEVAKKDPSKRIPDTCSTCHDSREDKRVMAVASFDKTCSSCHLDQILSKERVSGPKGIAFLSLPGLDLQTLKQKKASIGEWPDASEADLTPFMKVMISRHERGRALIKTVDSLNLQDLTNASDDQIKAVTNLVWEIKGLFHALIKGKTSDVLGDFNIGGGAKLSAALVADLTASIPRDVLASAQQQWLPKLAKEMADRPVTSDQAQGGWSTVTTESQLTGSAGHEEQSGSDAHQAAPLRKPSSEGGETGNNDTEKSKRDAGKKAQPAKELPPPMRAGLRDVERTAQLSADEHGGGTSGGRWLLPSGTPRSIKAKKDAEKETEPEGAAGKAETRNTKPDGGKNAPSADEQARANKAEATDPANDGGNETLSAKEQPQGNATDQNDDLLFPTEEELRAIKAGNKNAGTSSQPDETAGTTDTANAKRDGAASAEPASQADSGSVSAEPGTKAAPVINIESDVDPESWAEYGGWYRQDYAIFYRPTGHKDKFIYSWLFLTGPQAPKDDANPAAMVFNALAGKDAQGSCTKCHSVDDILGKGRVVNFSPPSVESKQGRFTNFIHEPHFGIMDNRGCLTCHELGKDRPYLKSYEQGNPKNFASNFSAAKKELCQTCHTSNKARQDCLLCHNYHVNGVSTPIINTKLPAQ